MRSKKINFEVTTGASAYWIAVDSDDLDLTNGKGSAVLSTEIEHVLIWQFVGNPNTKMSIVGTDSAGEVVVEVKESKIRRGRHRGAGFRIFEVG